LSRADAINQVVAYMQRIHSESARLGRPYIKIGLADTFIDWTYNGISAYQDNAIGGMDYKDLLTDMVNAVNAAGERLYFLHVDSPYDFVTKRTPAAIYYHADDGFAGEGNCTWPPSGFVPSGFGPYRSTNWETTDWMGQILAVGQQAR